MGIYTVQYEQWSAGYFGAYLQGRKSWGPYAAGAKEIFNLNVLPQGPLDRRRGFEYIYTIGLSAAIDPTKVRLQKFSTTSNQEYILVFYHLSLLIFRNDNLVATLATPYTADDVHQLYFNQKSDSVFITHTKYLPKILKRDGLDSVWTIKDTIFTKTPFFQFNSTQQLSASAATGSITLTLSDTIGYWQAGHVRDGVTIKMGIGQTTPGIMNITGLFQDANGGTAVASAGTAANAFDGNAATTCTAGTNGWIGYTQTNAIRYKTIGINPNNTATYTLTIEAADDAAFTTNLNVVGTVTFAATSGTFSYIDLAPYSAQKAFRIRETAGGTLDVKELVCNIGLKVTATVTTTIPTGFTANQNAWKETAFSSTHGYPSTSVFYASRMVYGGVKDAGNALFLSNQTDIYNFDDVTTTNATDPFVLVLDEAQNITIKALKTTRDQLAVFTDEAEFVIKALNPTSPEKNRESSNGCNQQDPIEIDDEFIYIHSNSKELLSFYYDFANDKFLNKKNNDIAHDIFTDDNPALRMAYLRSYRDTQSNMLFVIRADGTMAKMTIDKSEEVLAFDVYNTNGSFNDVEVVKRQFNNGDGTVSSPLETLYAVVNRPINGVDTIFLEAMTNDDIYMDCWFSGSNPTPSQFWAGISPLANVEVDVIADGLYEGKMTVSPAGTLTLTRAVTFLSVGLSYTSEFLSLPIVVTTPKNGIVKGKPIRLNTAAVQMINSISYVINGTPVDLRFFGDAVLNFPLQYYTGTHKESITNLPGTDQEYDPNVQIVIDKPFPFTMTSLTLEVECE